MAWTSILRLTLLILLGPVFAQYRGCWRNTRCTGPIRRSFEGPWSSNIFSPKSRSVVPIRVTDDKGKVSSWNAAYHTLRNNGSTMVVDFGFEVGGIIHLDYRSNGHTQIGLAFSEGKEWSGQWSDSSNGRFQGPDGAIYVDVNPSIWSQKWTMPDEYHRGGFRYLTLFLRNAEPNMNVVFWNVTVEIGFQPTWTDLSAYQGYFHSSDVELNKIWYAGAYTLQTNSVPTNTGRQVPMLARSWANNATLGSGDTILVDGAKRDRAVWPGDMGIALPSAFFSTGDLESARNALQIMYDTQMSDGGFYESGPPLSQKNSDTYHMWTLIGTYNYIVYSDDLYFLDFNWVKFEKAMEFILRKVGSNNLLSVTGKRDWARLNQGEENSAANMLLYHTLDTGILLAKWKIGGGSAEAARWSSRIAFVKDAINTLLFDQKASAFRDSLSRPALYPQDANALAIRFGIVSPDRARLISKSLTKNWTPIGAQTPELPGHISPFISGFEVQGHFMLGDTARALDLIRRTWGWYLQHEGGTQSTMIEGYKTDGSFGYRAERGYHNDLSYVSHAHGWSTGATSALTNYIAGIDIQDRGGAAWTVKPQFGILDFAEAGFTTRRGLFRTRWERAEKEYNVTIETPIGTRGTVLLPSIREESMVTLVNGTSANGRQVGTGLEFELAGGSWNITVRILREPPLASPAPALLPAPGWLGGLFSGGK